MDFSPRTRPHSTIRRVSDGGDPGAKAGFPVSLMRHGALCAVVRGLSRRQPQATPRLPSTVATRQFYPQVDGNDPLAPQSRHREGRCPRRIPPLPRGDERRPQRARPEHPKGETGTPKGHDQSTQRVKPTHPEGKTGTPRGRDQCTQRARPAHPEGNTGTPKWRDRRTQRARPAHPEGETGTPRG